MTEQISDLLDRWTDAERRCDTGQLATVLADDFVGVGPVGFVLDREGWLGRFAHGLHYDQLYLDELALHRHGRTVIAVAHQHADGRSGDIPLPPDTRVSFTVVEPVGGTPQIAGMQYSFIGPPLGSGS